MKKKTIRKILLLDNAHEILSAKLSDAGIQITAKPDMTSEELMKVIGLYDGIIVRSKHIIDKVLIDESQNLEFIARIGSGMENINVAYAEKKGILCINSPEGNRDAVGEHALAMLLALFNRICIADMEVRKGMWNREPNRGTEIMGKTVGIIGYGNTGSAFAQKLSGFRANVIAYDKYKTGFSDPYVREVSLKDLMKHSEIVSLHIPLTDETRKMADKGFFESFSKKIYLVNTSRGEVVNTADLVALLQSGIIAGACLDVIEYENFSFENMNPTDKNTFDYLINSQNVVLSPHIAGWTKESHIKLSEVLADKILSLYPQKI
ncbi:MAG: NAD(P)-dependent oxidoreductase [Bacteroidota bacterium]